MSIRGMLDDIGLEFDEGDRWGSAVTLSFDCAHALHHAGEEVPEDWQYGDGIGCRGLSNDEDYGAVVITEAIIDNVITWDDVRTLGSMLVAMSAMLEENGESY